LRIAASGSMNAVSFSSARTTNRFPSPLHGFFVHLAATNALNFYTALYRLHCD